jgi:hypothetical protein
MNLTKGAKMKQAMNVIAGILVVVGIMMAAGAGGDCDGKCMEYANTLTETVVYGAIGLMLMLSGAVVFIINESNN